MPRKVKIKILFDKARARQFWRENMEIGDRSADGRGWDPMGIPFFLSNGALLRRSSAINFELLNPLDKSLFSR